MTTTVTQLITEVGYNATLREVNVSQLMAEVGYTADLREISVSQLVVEVGYVVNEAYVRRFGPALQS